MNSIAMASLTAFWRLHQKDRLARTPARPMILRDADIHCYPFCGLHCPIAMRFIAYDDSPKGGWPLNHNPGVPRTIHESLSNTFPRRPAP